HRIDVLACQHIAVIVVGTAALVLAALLVLAVMVLNHFVGMFAPLGIHIADGQDLDIALPQEVAQMAAGLVTDADESQGEPFTGCLALGRRSKSRSGYDDRQRGRCGGLLDKLTPGDLLVGCVQGWPPSKQSLSGFGRYCLSIQPSGLDARTGLHFVTRPKCPFGSAGRTAKLTSKPPGSLADGCLPTLQPGRPGRYCNSASGNPVRTRRGGTMSQPSQCQLLKIENVDDITHVRFVPKTLDDSNVHTIGEQLYSLINEQGRRK